MPLDIDNQPRSDIANQRANIDHCKRTRLATVSDASDNTVSLLGYSGQRSDTVADIGPPNIEANIDAQPYARHSSIFL
jgi:hypothetical protein